MKAEPGVEALMEKYLYMYWDWMDNGTVHQGTYTSLDWTLKVDMDTNEYCILLTDGTNEIRDESIRYEKPRPIVFGPLRRYLEHLLINWWPSHD
jgi:hypothetical protein